jgi:hypothetical protein
MAELNLGTSLSADEYLELVTSVNRRRNKSNARLRGLGALAGVSPTMRTSSGFDTSLRAYSKAKDEEILSSIIGYAADHDFLDADGMFDENMFRDWFAEQGLPDKMYEKSAAEFRKRAGRFESGLAAAHQVKMRPGLFKKQQLDIKASDTEADKKRNEKYSERLADEIAMNAYDYVDQDMDPETALETALEQARGRFKKGEIAGGADSPWARSAYVQAREKFNKLVASKETPVQVYDTRKGQLEFMTPTEIEAINKDAPSTILPPGERPADVGDTTDLRALKEKRGIISPVAMVPFNEMNEEEQALTRENYLTVTQLIKSDQKQNVLLQNLTAGPLAKRTYDGVQDIIKIEDPQFFQRNFEVPNAYELYADFKSAIEDRKENPKDYFITDEYGQKQLMTPEMMEEEFVRKGVQRTGWDPDHIYSLIRPDLYEMGAKKYKRYRLGR